MTQKKKKKLSPGSALLLCLICLLLAVAAYSGWQLWGIYSKYHHNTVSQNRVSDVFYSQEGTTGQPARPYPAWRAPRAPRPS